MPYLGHHSTFFKKYSLFIWNSIFTWLPELHLAATGMESSQEKYHLGQHPTVSIFKALHVGGRLRVEGLPSLSEPAAWRVLAHSSIPAGRRPFHSFQVPNPPLDWAIFLMTSPIAQLQWPLTTCTSMGSTAPHRGLMQPVLTEAQMLGAVLGGKSDISQMWCPFLERHSSERALLRRPHSKPAGLLQSAPIYQICRLIWSSDHCSQNYSERRC